GVHLLGVAVLDGQPVALDPIDRLRGAVAYGLTEVPGAFDVGGGICELAGEHGAHGAPQFGIALAEPVVRALGERGVARCGVVCAVEVLALEEVDGQPAQTVDLELCVGCGGGDVDDLAGDPGALREVVRVPHRCVGGSEDAGQDITTTGPARIGESLLGQVPAPGG